MLTKKGRLLLAALSTIMCFFTVAYVSCTKPGSEPLCNGVTCMNGGYCNKGKCICPAGYEGTDCSTKSAERFFGLWRIYQKVVGSDSSRYIGKDSTYYFTIKKTATPTTIFFDNFLGNEKYNNILAVLDSADSRHFIMDTTVDVNMWFDHVKLRFGSGGTLSADNKKVRATMIIRKLNKSNNWQVDTLSLDCTRQ